MSFISSIFTNIIKDLVVEKLLKKEQNLPITLEEKEENKELESIRKRIAKNREFPTSEKISITIYPQIHNILLCFFPNSFKNETEAYDYYKSFCQRARDLGEDEKIYKEENLLKDGIYIEIELDMISGMKRTWNYTNNNSNLPSSFTFFNYNYINNNELKQEVVQLYNDNWDFLTEIGMCYNWGDGRKEIGFQRIDIMPYGLDYLMFVCDYNKFQFWISRNQNMFQLPVDDIICALRKNQTYYLKDNENKILKENIEKQNYKDVWRFEIDFEKNRAEMANKFINVFIDVQYYRPAEITSDDFDKPIYYIDPFSVKGFYSS